MQISNVFSLSQIAWSRRSERPITDKYFSWFWPMHERMTEKEENEEEKQWSEIRDFHVSET
jgi:hypothetical protein